MRQHDVINEATHHVFEHDRLFSQCALPARMASGPPASVTMSRAARLAATHRCEVITAREPHGVRDHTPRPRERLLRLNK